MKSRSRLRFDQFAGTPTLARVARAPGRFGALGVLLALALGLSGCYATSTQPFAALEGDGGLPPDSEVNEDTEVLDTTLPDTQARAMDGDDSIPPSPPVMNPDLDRDGDGYPQSKDCNDTNPAINPSALDNNPCDPIAYNCAPVPCTSIPDQVDLDRDGYTAQWDCNDSDSTTRPGAPDDPCDFIDTNCDGVEYSCNPSPNTDNDGDGYSIEADCDDNNAGVNPGAYDPSSCDDFDENCDKQELYCNSSEDAGVEIEL